MISQLTILLLFFSSLGSFLILSHAEKGFPNNVVDQEKFERQSKLHQLSNKENALLNYTGCGGVIEMVDFAPIYIKYKVDETYNDNEMCVWTINNLGFSFLGFRKIQSGFEAPHDFVQISDEVSHAIMGGIPGEEHFGLQTVSNFALVMFSTDNSVTGSGFELEIIAAGDPAGSDYEQKGLHSQLNSGSMSLSSDNNFFLLSTIVISPVNTDSAQLTAEYDFRGWAFNAIYVFVLERNGGVLRVRFLDILEGSGTKHFEVNYFTTFVLSSVNALRFDGVGLTISWTSNGEDDLTYLAQVCFA